MFFGVLHISILSLVKSPRNQKNRSVSACESLGSKRRPSWRPNVGTSMTVMARAIKKRNSGWLVVDLPLRKIWVRQWGWDDIPYMKWKIKFMFQSPPTSRVSESSNRGTVHIAAVDLFGADYRRKLRSETSSHKQVGNFTQQVGETCDDGFVCLCALLMCHCPWIIYIYIHERSWNHIAATFDKLTMVIIMLLLTIVLAIS